ncbi:MAG: hypothetical protein AABZ74_03230 [Cyanobacteriota bacterium]
MKYNPEKHHRKSTRLKNYDYSSNGAYFVTICVKNRECIFGEIKDGEIILSKIGEIVKNNWLEIKNNFENIDIDEFVIMPNHLHVIILINSEMPILNSNMVLGINKGLMNQTPALDSNIDLANNTSELDLNIDFVNKIEKLEQNDPYRRGLIHQTLNTNNTKKISYNKISNESNLMLNPKITLGKIIRYYKAKTTQMIKKNNIEYFQWQKNYHEWVIKNEKHLQGFRDYIYQNPLKWEIDSENPNKK